MNCGLYNAETRRLNGHTNSPFSHGCHLIIRMRSIPDPSPKITNIGYCTYGSVTSTIASSVPATLIAKRWTMYKTIEFTPRYSRNCLGFPAGMSGTKRIAK